MSRWIVIVNPVNSGVVLIALVLLGVLVLKRSLTRPRFQDGNLEAQDVFPQSPGAIPGLFREHPLTGARASVLSAYRASVSALAKATGILPVSNDTFREYASRITTLVMTGGQPFTELTGIAEMALYSDYDIDSQAIARAELLARQVREFCIGAA